SCASPSWDPTSRDGDYRLPAGIALVESRSYQSPPGSTLSRKRHPGDGTAVEEFRLRAAPGQKQPGGPSAPGELRPLRLRRGTPSGEASVMVLVSPLEAVSKAD